MVRGDRCCMAWQQQGGCKQTTWTALGGRPTRVRPTRLLQCLGLAVVQRAMEERPKERFDSSLVQPGNFPRHRRSCGFLGPVRSLIASQYHVTRAMSSDTAPPAPTGEAPQRRRLQLKPRDPDAAARLDAERQAHLNKSVSSGHPICGCGPCAPPSHARLPAGHWQLGSVPASQCRHRQAPDAARSCRSRSFWPCCRLQRVHET